MLGKIWEPFYGECLVELSSLDFNAMHVFFLVLPHFKIVLFVRRQIVQIID